MKTLFLNPPSFEGFDGGAGSRWPASREVEASWYPVWLCYPAGMLPESKLVDGPPHQMSIEQTVQMAKDFELWVERFYGEYYFRPKAAWRVVKQGIVNNDIPRLYKEAREYLSLRSKRKQFVKQPGAGERVS
jgi:hypothetical protein